MHFSRRSLSSILMTSFLAGGLVFASAAFRGRVEAQPQDRMAGGNPLPPMLPGEPSFGLTSAHPKLAEANSQRRLQKNQREMKKEIQQLCTMVEELKQESDKTNSADTLSVSLVEKTKKIEKLAEKINKLARGH